MILGIALSLPNCRQILSKIMKPSYKLTKSNKIYLLVIAVGAVVYSFIVPPNSLYAAGQTFGKLLSFVIFPAIFGWVVWLISGKKQNGGGMVFNLVLTLMVLAQIPKANLSSNDRQQITGLKEDQERLRKTLLNSEDLDEIDQAQDEYLDSMQSRIHKIANDKSGSERKLWQMIGTFVDERVEIEKEWNTAFQEVQSDDVFNFALLDSNESYQHQKKVIENYIGKTEFYLNFFKDLMPTLEKRINDLSVSSKQAEAFIEGAKRSHNRQKPIFIPLMEAHIKYGGNMLSTLDLLNTHPDQWSYEDDDIWIDDDDLLNQYNENINDLTQLEETINKYSDLLVESMGIQ